MNTEVVDFRSSNAVHTIIKNAKARPATGNMIKSSKDFVQDFVPPDYLLEGILQRRFIYSMTGQTGAGKSAICLLLAACIGSGKPFGDIKVEQGRVVYFAGENPDDIRMRWIAMSQCCDFDINTIDVHFVPGAFQISELAPRLREEVEALGGASLVVVDTSAAFFEGENENDNAQMVKHARMLRNLIDTVPGGPTILVPSHPVKNAGPENLLPRGGGAFLAEVDGNLTAAKDGLVTKLHWQGKHRGPEFEPIMFKLKGVTHPRLKDSRGRLIPTVVAQHLTEASQEAIAKATRADEDKLLDLLKDNGSKSIADLARLAGWTLKDGTAHKTKVVRILEKLIKQKLVKKERGGFVLTKAGTTER